MRIFHSHKICASLLKFSQSKLPGARASFCFSRLFWNNCNDSEIHGINKILMAPRRACGTTTPFICITRNRYWNDNSIVSTNLISNWNSVGVSEKAMIDTYRCGWSHRRYLFSKKLKRMWPQVLIHVACYITYCHGRRIRIIFYM